jgi:hypothetical protein
MALGTMDGSPTFSVAGLDTGESTALTSRLGNIDLANHGGGGTGFGVPVPLSGLRGRHDVARKIGLHQDQWNSLGAGVAWGHQNYTPSVTVNTKPGIFFLLFGY